MLNLAGLVGDSIVDGPGIRMTVFCQGCPHHCKGCHNAETWSFEGGTPMEEEEILHIIATNPLAKGVTFSGGEPFAQAAGFAKLAELLHEKDTKWQAIPDIRLRNCMTEQKNNRNCFIELTF